MKLTYHKGTILLKGDYSIPNTKWDARSECHRSQALYYRDIIEYLEKSGISYEDSVLDFDGNDDDYIDSDDDDDEIARLFLGDMNSHRIELNLDDPFLISKNRFLLLSF